VPHTLLGAALSLLLVFRTNGCFARFNEGRALWGSLVKCSRDWIRLASNYFPTNLKKKAARYVQAYAFVLKSYLRSGRTRSDPNDPTAYRDDPTVIVSSLLPKEEAALVLSQKNQPFFILFRMTQILKEAGPSIPHHISHHLEHTLAEMLSIAGSCDRILGTPIPLSYTRHTSRSLMLWLTTLPFALYPCTGLLTAPAMLCISFIFLGIDEIGVEIEEPFSIMPLLPLCKKIAMDSKLAMEMPHLESQTLLIYDSF
jgi:putative membrane protein